MSKPAKVPPPAPVLDDIEPILPGTFDQAAIDALFGEDIAEAAPRSGLRAMLDSRSVSHDRLPMLEVVAERMMRSLSTSIRGLTSDPVEVSVEEIRSVRFGDFMDRLAMPAMIGVVKIQPWQGFGLITVDSPLIFAIVDALMGGSTYAGAPVIEGRQFTSIEIALVAKMVRLTLEEFARAFGAVTEIAANLERIELNPRFAAIATPSNVAVAIRIRYTMNRSGGSMTLLLPYATIEPARDRLAQRFMGERDGPTNLWRAHLEAELLRTETEISVVLGERSMALADVVSIKPGDLIRLGTAPDDRLEIRCRGIPVGLAQVGQRRGHLAISPTTTIASQRQT